MLEIQRMTLVKAIKLLNSIGVEYAIIDGEGIDEDGGIAMTTGSLKQFLEATIV
jgi:hypothetical protein